MWISDPSGNRVRLGQELLDLMTSRRLLVFLCLAWFSGSSALALAQGSLNPHVTWTVSVEPGKARPGDKVDVLATYEVVSDWHLYAPDFVGTGFATKLGVDSPLLKVDGPPKFPAPEIKKVVIIDEESHRLLSGKGDIRQTFVVSKDASAGRLDFRALLAYMTCSGELCDPPTMDEPHALSLEILQDTETEAPRAPLSLSGLSGPGSDAVDGGEEELVVWNVRLEPKQIRRGETATFAVDYEVRDGHYIYAPDPDPLKGGTKIEVSSPQVKLKGEPTFPEPRIKELFGEKSRVLAGKGTMQQSFLVGPEAAAGELKLDVLVSFQACSKELCFPGEYQAEVSLTVSSESSVPVQKTSIWALIALMIGGGLVALLLPCTYPMIPITIGYFTHQAEARKGSVLPLALAYGAGIILSFNIVGWLLAPVIMAIAFNPWFNLAICVLFFAFGLSFLGLFNITLPGAVTNLSAKASGASGYLGVLILGATLVIASFACTAPVMTPLLVLASEGGSLGYVTAGMTAFGATMATPFILLALFPAWVRSVPRSGEWMHTVKVFLGFLLLASCLIFFSKAEQSWELQWLPREVCLVLWAAIFGTAGLYLFGVVRLKDEQAEGVGSLRLLVALLCITGALYFFMGASGTRLNSFLEAFLPGYNLSRVGAEDSGKKSTLEGRIVEKELERGLQVAREKGMRVLVNFTGVNCSNCKLMEARVFPEVAGLMKQFVEIRLKIDQGQDQEEKKAYKARLIGKSAGIPAYVIVDPSEPNKVIAKHTKGYTGKAQFAAFLEANIN
jgi:thiol:disulfide interchange protein DsbD